MLMCRGVCVVKGERNYRLCAVSMCATVFPFMYVAQPLLLQHFYLLLLPIESGDKNDVSLTVYLLPKVSNEGWLVVGFKANCFTRD